MSQASENQASIGAGAIPSRPYSVSAAAALTVDGITFTWTTNDPGVTDGTATIADGATVGDDNDAGDALSAIEDQINKIAADLAAILARLNSHQTALVDLGFLAES